MILEWDEFQNILEDFAYLLQDQRVRVKDMVLKRAGFNQRTVYETLDGDEKVTGTDRAVELVDNKTNILHRITNPFAVQQLCDKLEIPLGFFWDKLGQWITIDGKMDVRYIVMAYRMMQYPRKEVILRSLPDTTLTDDELERLGIAPSAPKNTLPLAVHGVVGYKYPTQVKTETMVRAMTETAESVIQLSDPTAKLEPESSAYSPEGTFYWTMKLTGDSFRFEHPERLRDYTELVLFGRNNEFGRGRTNFGWGGKRVQCLNMAIFDNVKDTTFEFIHGSEDKYKEHLLSMIEEVEQESAYTLDYDTLVYRAVSDCVKRIIRGAESIHRHLSDAVKREIADPRRFIQEELKNRYNLSDALVETIEANWKSDGEDPTYYGVAQAITMHAKPENIPNEDKRWNLSRIGGDLLTGNAPIQTG